MRYYRNCELAFLGELETIMTSGKEIDSRNGKCKEILQESVTILNPMERCLFLKGRNDNIFHKVAETLWVLAGRNDMGFLEYYLPRCKEWSDDGLVWRAGYGPRLRNYAEYDDYLGVDQIEECVKLLNKDPNTRRAVISLWDPSLDNNDSKDIPCNNWLNFIIRDGKLHLSIAQRSSDVWWGFSGINTFEWSVLMQMMAHWTGTEVGHMVYFITSFHLYEPMWEKARDVLNNNQRWIYEVTEYNCIKDGPKFTTDFSSVDRELGWILNDAEEALHNHVYVKDITWGIKDPFLKLCTQMLYLYHAYKEGESIFGLLEMIQGMEDSDLRVAAAQYLERHVPI